MYVNKFVCTIYNIYNYKRPRPRPLVISLPMCSPILFFALQWTLCLPTFGRWCTDALLVSFNERKPSLSLPAMPLRRLNPFP